jgi:two-component system sensor histidine kinase PhoQ
MKAGGSIRARLIVGAAFVLLGFLALAGYAVQRAHDDSARDAQFARLQSTVYLLLAGAELDAQGKLVMPPSFPEPRLSLPASGLYASVANLNRNEHWQSPSSVGMDLPFAPGEGIGRWTQQVVRKRDASFLATTYAVRWDVGGLQAPLVVSVLQDVAPLEREGAAFKRTLWAWLGATALVLLVSQTLLLEWALAPLGRVAREVREMEEGRQERIAGRYPREIAALTGNINALVQNERVRQTRYGEALSYLAHSLKTPLAVLRASSDDAARLPAVVSEQVARMDDIVQHQLARAAAGSSALFAAPVELAPIIDRIRASLEKVYAGKQVTFDVQCDRALSWRIDEGEAFELLGNLMDNAAKWSRRQVRVEARREAGVLHVVVEDDGAGFSNTQEVLKLHVRGDERVPGHGVGLAVVSEIVRAHGGSLDLGRSALGGAKVHATMGGS